MWILKCVSSVSMLCMLFAVAVFAGVNDGSVIMCGSNWNSYGATKLELLSLPSKARTQLDGANCLGGCFSPDGKKVAYAKSRKIYTVNIDGTGSTEVGGGASLIQDRPMMTWVKVNGTDYIYWTHWPTSSSFHRLNLSTKVADDIPALSGVKMDYGTVSADGTKAAATTGTVPGFPNDWYAFYVELGSSPAQWNFGNGCQGTISPNGLYVTHNTRAHTGPDGKSYGEHKVFYIQRVADAKNLTTAQQKNFEWCKLSTNIGPLSPGGNGHRFSRSSNDHVIINGDNSSLLHWPSRTSVSLGQGIGQDFYSGTGSTTPTVETPIIEPYGGNFTDSIVRVTLRTSTTGATIHYTTNGTNPTTSSPTYSSALDIRLAKPGDSVVVKAIGVKSGMDQSSVAEAKFRRIASNPITITSPTNGQNFAIGDEVTIRWTADTSKVKDVVIKVSNDNGISYASITPNAIYANTSDWGTHKWKIPAMLVFTGSDGLPDTLRFSGKKVTFLMHPYLDEGTIGKMDGAINVATTTVVALDGNRVSGSRVQVMMTSGRAVRIVNNTGEPAARLRVYSGSGRLLAGADFATAISGTFTAHIPPGACVYELRTVSGKEVRDRITSVR